LDTSTTIGSFTLDLDGWFGMARGQNGDIFGLPFYRDDILKIDFRDPDDENDADPPDTFNSHINYSSYFNHY